MKKIMIKKFEIFNESKEDEIIRDFESAYKKGSCSFNEEYYGNNPKLGEFHLYDNYYQYKDAIFSIYTRTSGDWYHTELIKSDIDPHSFKLKIYDQIKKLEDAMDKIVDC